MSGEKDKERKEEQFTKSNVQSSKKQYKGQCTQALKWDGRRGPGYSSGFHVDVVAAIPSI